MENLKYKNLLFVEDDKAFAKIMLSFFEMFALTTIHATSVSEAIRLYDHRKIDFIISDISLGEQNGFDFVRYVRRKDENIPVAMLTSYKDEETLLQSIKLNLSSFLIKPCSYQSIIETLEMIFNKLQKVDTSVVELKDGFLYDLNLKILRKDTVHYTLNKKEILFMEMLLENKNRIISKEQLEYTLWDESSVSPKMIANFISNIRKRFGKDFIYTIPNIGYRFTL